VTSQNEWLGYKAHPAPAPGMSTAQLAQHQANLAEAARLRLHTAGAPQYELPDRQRFEDYSPQRLLAEFTEELLDMFNYLAMVHIQVDRRLRPLIEAASVKAGAA
jgi:hypothetical protein